jgi:hypothetical protein
VLVVVVGVGHVAVAVVNIIHVVAVLDHPVAAVGAMHVDVLGCGLMGERLHLVDRGQGTSAVAQ